MTSQSRYDDDGVDDDDAECLNLAFQFFLCV